MAPNRVALYGALARAVAVTALTFKVSPRIPRAFKWIIVFLLALNIRTFPLAWHCTLFSNFSKTMHSIS